MVEGNGPCGLVIGPSDVAALPFTSSADTVLPSLALSIHSLQPVVLCCLIAVALCTIALHPCPAYRHIWIRPIPDCHLIYQNACEPRYI
jgi:hypothetical protein